MTRVFDNLTQNLGDRVQESLGDALRLDVAVGYFNLRGWGLFSELVDERAEVAEDLPVARILVGMVLNSDQREAISDLESTLSNKIALSIDNGLATARAKEVIAQLREQLMRGLPNRHDKKVLQDLRRQIADGRVQVKAFTEAPLHGKTYIVHRNDHVSPCYAYVGSSNLTTAGLLHNLELNVEVVDQDDAKQLTNWFEDRWKNDFNIDLTDELLALLDESWASPIIREPYDVYLKLCYDLSADVRNGLSEYSLSGPLNALLLDYQRDAVKTLARRIHRRGGTMLGDVVGLGKTLTAIAVASLMREEYGYSTLVVCPKNLKGMWEQQLHKYQLHSTVVHYNVAARDLPDLQRYQLVIVDESHTMRNPDRQDYKALREYIERNASKVLLLTATPYNVGFDDVAAQLGLWIGEDDDLGVEPSEALQKNPNIFNAVDGRIRTLRAFKKSDEPEDWKRLMSEHLVRRTRSFIKRAAITAGNVDEAGPYLVYSDGTHFHFPKRIAELKTHSFGAGDPAALMASETTLDDIRSLALPRYTLIDYVDGQVSRTQEEEDLLERWQRGRGHVAGFVRTSLYKRLSSCGHSFVLSVRRHVARNALMVYALTNDLPVPIGSVQDSMFTNSDIDSEADTEFDPLALTPREQYEQLTTLQPKSITWVRPNVFTPELLAHIQRDTDTLEDLLTEFGEWSTTNDSKLEALLTLVTDQHPDEKVLVFTEYQDTADYLYEALVDAGVSNVGLATGATDDPTTIAAKFSPVSTANTDDPDYDGEVLPTGDQIRVLIATDVLSEGQNLQDAHIVVNYDLPWAIIRLIQRAGRVDRIGQLSDTVLVYSFVHESVEQVINLRKRIAGRLADHASAFGSDEEFFGSEAEVRILTDLYDGSMERLDELEGAEDNVDAASYAYQEWSTAVATDPSLATRIPSLPDLLHATKPGPPALGFPDGVACFVRTESGLDAYAFANSAKARLITAHEALALFRASKETPALEARTDHDDLLAEMVQGESAPLSHKQLGEGQMNRGIRQRVWKRLRGTLDELSPDSHDAIDALERFPLTSNAERRLQRALRETPEDLAAVVTALHGDGELVIARSGDDPIRIVSSMGTMP